MVVDSVLSAGLGRTVGEVLARVAVEHVAHGDAEPVPAADVVACDDDAIAMIGRFAPQTSRRPSKPPRPSACHSLRSWSSAAAPTEIGGQSRGSDVMCSPGDARRRSRRSPRT
jgi:hypothetical protein